MVKVNVRHVEEMDSSRNLFFSKKISSGPFKCVRNVNIMSSITKNINAFGTSSFFRTPFDEALLVCVFSRDLSTKLQDTLDFIEESIDETLAKLCSNFNPHTYQRLLNAYRLRGKSLTFMDQLQMHFVNVVQTRTMEIVLRMIGTTKKDPTLSSYADLCKVSHNSMSIILQ